MKIQTLNKILLGIATSILAIIFIVTLVFFISTKGQLKKQYRRIDPSPLKVANMNSNKENNSDAFTDIEQIRIFTKKESDEADSAVVVVTPWFSYPSGDKALFEELSQKERLIKSLFVNYFSSMNLNQIRSKGEASIKTELLEEINSNLVLGQIRAVYFNDYIFID